ncbi:MAG: hypothetical protein SGILL_009900 [Bacillariaceae sp.]
MGCDWYDFKAFCSSGNAVMVTNNDIKEVHKAGSSNDDDDSDSDDDSGVFPEKGALEPEVVDWLLNQVKGYKVQELGSGFVLIMHEDMSLVEMPSLSVPGPYEIENEYVRIDIKKAPEGGEEYNQLLDIARKLTPPGNKLSFQPGQYKYSMTSSHVMSVKELSASNDAEKNDGTDEDETEDTKPPAPSESVTAAPMDFELVVGEGENQKTLKSNKTLLACFFPNFKELTEDVLEANKIELKQLSPEAVAIVLDLYTTRKSVKLPGRWGSERDLYNSVLAAKTVFGVGDEGSKPPPKKPKTEHPALADPRWLDATFIVGADKEEVKANRLALAAMNPVLSRILFGTGIIAVDSSKPIEWPEFDVGAVRCVFLALLQRGSKEVVVPLESVEPAKALLDYLMETREDLNLYYDTPFKREFLKPFYLNRYYDDDDGDEGLKL